MSTIRDVARKAGVSVATVSHVINGSRHVSEETRNKVLNAVTSLQYRRDGIARSLRRSRSDTLGVMISDITNPFFSDIVRGIENTIHIEMPNHNVILCNTEENEERELRYLEVLQEKRVEGIIAAPVGGNAHAFNSLVSSGVPVVFVDRALQGVGVDSVGSNNREASRQLIKHLLDHGHKRIALMRALLNANTINDRVLGYQDALRDAGIELDPTLILQAHSSMEGGQQIGQRMLAMEPRPDAVFGTNNFMTLGSMQAIVEAGLQCPEDIAVVGFDDFPWATSFRPRLTAISQPSYEIGCRAAQLLLERIEKKRTGAEVHLSLDCSVMIRDSCGAHQASR
jgi:LacI family transcriptional regulator